MEANNELDSSADTALEPRWYAIWTRFRHEKKVQAVLRERGIEVFLPLLGNWSQRANRKKFITEPLFPGYCFARFPITNCRQVLTVHGVVDIAGNAAGAIKPVPDVEIASLKRLVESEFRYDSHPFLRGGMKVEVIRGPLMGVRGRILRQDRPLKLVISVALIQVGASVEIDAADIVPI